MRAAAVVAFADFYRAHYSSLVGFFTRRVQDRELARDLTADAFRIAWMRWEESPGVGRAWLFRVAHNLVGDEWRRRARQGPVDKLSDALEGPDQQRDAEVRLLLASMTPLERHLLVLTYWDGLSAGEVAAVLGISRTNVWTRLHRARRAFALAWHEPVSDPPPPRPSRVPHPSEDCP